MITIEETETGLRITRDTLVIEIEAAAIATSLGPIIAELACGVPWNAPQISEVPRASDADFAAAWDIAARLSGNHAA